MRLLDIGGTSVRLAPETVAALIAVLLFAPLPATALALTARFLHEAAHILTARRMGFAVEELHLLPFGASMRLRHPAGNPHGGLVALAGPLCNLVVAGACALMQNLFSSEHLQPFLWINLGMGMLNLLPILPLDGGRLLSELLGRRYRSHTVRLVAGGLSLGCALSLLGTAVWLYFREQIPLAGLSFPGGVLLVSIRHLLTEQRSGVAAILSHRAHLREGHGLEVFPLAMHASEPLSAAAAAVRSGRYLIVYVIGGRGEQLGMLGEETLLDALGRLGADALLKEALNIQK